MVDNGLHRTGNRITKASGKDIVLLNIHVYFKLSINRIIKHPQKHGISSQSRMGAGDGDYGSFKN